MSSMKVFSGFALALTLLGFVSGCGANCESVCEDRKQCPDASPDERTRDCDKSCGDDTARADRFGCTSQNADLVDCFAKLNDLCDPAPSACSGEQARLYQCRQVYCADHPDEVGCAW